MNSDTVIKRRAAADAQANDRDMMVQKHALYRDLLQAIAENRCNNPANMARLALEWSLPVIELGPGYTGSTDPEAPVVTFERSEVPIGLKELAGSPGSITPPEGWQPRYPVIMSEAKSPDETADLNEGNRAP